MINKQLCIVLPFELPTSLRSYCVVVDKPSVPKKLAFLDLHCLQGQVISGLSLT